MKSMTDYYRMFALGAMTWSILMYGASIGWGQTPDLATHDGILVAVAGDRLTMTDTKGKEHSHTLSKTVKLTLDGKDCLVTDLQPGTRLRVTQPGTGQGAVIRVEAIDKALEFATHIHEGKFGRMQGNQLTMINMEGLEQKLTVRGNAHWTLDGKPCQLADIKTGTRLRAFTLDPFSATATRIESISQNQDFASNRHQGKLISIIGDKLKFTDLEGKSHDLSVTPVAWVTLDGKPIKCADLKPDARIRITTLDAFSTVATGIEAIDSQADFSADTHDGIVVSIRGNQLVMSDLNGNHEHTCTLSADVKITLDGVVIQAAQLTPGAKIRVTSSNDESSKATRVEAIAKNKSFSISL